MGDQIKIDLDDIVVYGAGGTSRDLMETLEAMNEDQRRWNILGFLDDDPAKHGSEVLGYPILGGGSLAVESPAYRNVKICIGIANSMELSIRRTIRERLGLSGDRFPAIVHPTAVVSTRSSIGEGVVFLAGSFCSNMATVSKHVMVLQNTVISHDAVVSDYVTFAANVSTGGGIHVGEGSFIGLGAAILPGVRVGTMSRIGMGAVVIRDVPGFATVAGNPARIIAIDKPD